MGSDNIYDLSSFLIYLIVSSLYSTAISGIRAKSSIIFFFFLRLQFFTRRVSQLTIVYVIAYLMIDVFKTANKKRKKGDLAVFVCSIIGKRIIDEYT